MTGQRNGWKEGAGSGMRAQVEQRVSELKAEHKKGQQMLAELEAKEAELRQTLLRISGAIQVLEELLAAAESPAGDGDAAREAPADGLPVQADA
jgi:hypothetical protein